MDDDRLGRILMAQARRGVPSTPPPLAGVDVLRGAASCLEAAGLGARLVARILELRARGEPARELERAAKLGVRVLLPDDAAFPPDLRVHPFRPPVVWVQGEAIAPAPRVGLVGARDATPAMERFAESLGAACARTGVPVVSGMARGIDAAGQRGAADAGGAVLAVLGCGLDVDYPKATTGLRRRIRERGTLLSSYPLGTPPDPFHFPQRNRIVAALSAIVVVVQAGERSGTMSTARAALDSNTLVGAVPGSVLDPLARGTNLLLRDGAHVVLEAADMLEPILGVGAFDPAGTPASPARDHPDPELAGALGADVLHAEELAARLGIETGALLERLVALELDGRIERVPGPAFRRRDVRSTPGPNETRGRGDPAGS